MATNHYKLAKPRFIHLWVIFFLPNVKSSLVLTPKLTPVWLYWWHHFQIAAIIVWWLARLSILSDQGVALFGVDITRNAHPSFICGSLALKARLLGPLQA
jgi:hypothetical protein